MCGRTRVVGSNALLTSSATNDERPTTNDGSFVVGRWSFVVSSVVRNSAAAVWAVSDSARANSAAAELIAALVGVSSATRLVILTKSSTLSGEAKRAVPPVGMTWLGPAT